MLVFSPLTDSHGRAITDLRISITDRCNYRCVYCRAGNEGAQYSELPIADYLRLAHIFVDLGIEKIRLTGGEPLLRNGLIELIRELAKLRTRLSGDPLDLTVTTNGHLLEDQAARLKGAGLCRITVSMDAVDAETFARIIRVPGSFEKVQQGYRQRRMQEWGRLRRSFAKFSREHGVVVRFIEFMPLEEDRLWNPREGGSILRGSRATGAISSVG